MRILLISDTHGRLSQLGDVAAAAGCDAIVHAGDFGFYDDESVDRLTDREIALRIVHSELSSEQKKDCRALTHEARRAFVRERLPLSELPRYLSGELRFERPVYAVWGNHEDVEVIRRFRSDVYRVENLTLLHEEATYHLGDLHLFGLGGNFLVGAKLFQQPIAGGGGKVWSVLGQYARLLEAVRRSAVPGEQRLLVSHVSPGKEPFITLLGAWSGSDWIVSGHMDPPFALVWNEFGIRGLGEAESRLRDRIAEIEHAFADLDPATMERNRTAMETFSSLPRMTVTMGRGENVPAWYPKMWSVNLPDAHTGYAVLDMADPSRAVLTSHRTER